MSKDFYDKLQIISTATRDNKTIIILILTMFGSVGTNTFQYLDKIKNNFLTKVMTEQITLLATKNVCEK